MTDTKMDPEIKAKWLKALRSNRYKQTVGTLRRTKVGKQGEPVGYCCLGVLCNVIDSGAGTWTHRVDGDEWEGVMAYHGTAEYIIPSVAESVGLPRTIQDKLAGFNDDAGLDFKEIADWVEENL
jgi:hypothetical protein